MAKLARSVGRIDFWNLYGELTPEELAVHQAIFNAEPWGDDREDLRAALNTIATLPIENAAAAKVLKALVNYLPVHHMSEDRRSITPEQAAQMAKAAFAKAGI